ncbi:MAG: S8 family peptidase [Burkholderiales bacterium]
MNIKPLLIYSTLLLGVGVTQAETEINRLTTAQSPLPETTAHVIVKFKSSSEFVRVHGLTAKASVAEVEVASTSRAQLLGQRHGLALRAGRVLTEHAQVISGDSMSSEDLIHQLAADNDIEYAVVDQRRMHHAVPNDPLYTSSSPIVGNSGGPASGQWYLRGPNTETFSTINAVGAWQLTTGSSNIVVAVLDTGIRPEHPDLAGRLVKGYDMISDVVTANDGSARDSDPSDPGDWITSQESNTKSGPFYNCGASDSSWHGTKTASLIGAASNNSSGMAGVAWGIKIQPVRVLGKCGGFDSDVIAGMLWASGLNVPGVPNNPTPARVINLSLGSSGACPTSYVDAIATIANSAHPPVIVASAGNSSGQAVGAPANCPGIIAVAGLRQTGTKVGYSDLGTEVAISAPAGNCVNSSATAPCLYPILTASNSGTTIPATSTYTDAFNYSVGTSFSAPLVSGTITLMLSAQPSLSPEAVKAYLKSSARPFPTSVAGPTLSSCHAPDGTDQLECYCTSNTCGAGMLDAGRAVSSVMGIISNDCLLNWAEATYPGMFSSTSTSLFYAPYIYRFYPATGQYLGVSSEDNRIYYLAANVMHDEGPAANYYVATGCKQGPL